MKKLTEMTAAELKLLLEQKEQEEATAIVFPDTTEKGRPRSTPVNLETLLQHYGIRVRYNEMTKWPEIDIPGQRFHPDTALNSAMTYIWSLVKSVDWTISKDDYYSMLNLIATQNYYHPVREWIDQQTWDGVDRFPDFYATIECGRNSPVAGNQLKETLMRKWALSLVAALYHKDFSSEGVLCLYGPQGIGKTSWAYGLVPRESGGTWIKDSVALAVTDKDSVMKATSTWITELGELDATFKKSDLEALKSWITEKSDVIRPPYERSQNRYARRTGFYATLNTLEFLNDDENRRFWVLHCEGFCFPRYDLGQFWAQVRALYDAIRDSCATAEDRARTGEWGWFLSPTEREQLRTSQEPFRTVDPVIENLQAHVVPADMMTVARGESLTITAILQRCGIERITKKETGTAAKWIREQGYSADGQRRYTVQIESNLASVPRFKVIK